VENAVQTTLADAAELLRDRSIPFAVIGGVAVSVRGEPRFTADVDAVVGCDVNGALDLLRDLETTAFQPLFADVEEVVRSALILPLRHRATRTALDLALGMTGFEKQVIARAEPVALGGVTVPVATAEDLILMKLLAGRPRDAEDTARIVARQGSRLDWSYLFEQGAGLGEVVGQDLERELTALRRDADGG